MKRFPAEHTTIATSFAALRLKNLTFLSKEEVADHGLTEMETLIQHFGEDKTIGNVTSNALFDGTATLAEYSLAKNCDSTTDISQGQHGRVVENYA